MAALPWVMVTRNVTMSRRVTHIVPTRSDVTQIFGTNLAQNWVVLLPVAQLMLVLREKFILGNYICIRLKYPETLFVGTSAGDPGAEMDGDTSDEMMVSTHARLITLSVTNIPAHNVTRSHTLSNSNMFQKDNKICFQTSLSTSLEFEFECVL